MKKSSLLIAVLAVLTITVFLHLRTRAADDAGFQNFEFATIRWQGRDNTFVVRPSGKIEKLRPLFERITRADGVDERAFYMSIAMNTLAREGYELAGLTNDEVVMKRSMRRQ